ncbi:MAG: hypothetical protein R2719_06865 [Micropruina sp.]
MTDIVLIGGLWLPPRVWDDVVAELARLGHRGLPVALPGQVARDDGHETVTLDDQVAAVLAVVDASRRAAAGGRAFGGGVPGLDRRRSTRTGGCGADRRIPGEGRGRLRRLPPDRRRRDAVPGLGGVRGPGRRRPGRGRPGRAHRGDAAGARGRGPAASSGCATSAATGCRPR